MALVAYDYDSNSDNDEDTPTINQVVEPEKQVSSEIIENKITPALSDIESTKDLGDIVTTNKTTLFSNLPESRACPKDTLKEDKIEDFIPRVDQVIKEKQKVKITIPSLSQFADDENDEPDQKKKKYSSSVGSGLISLLPPVKGSIISTKSFVPKVIADRNKSVKHNANSNLVPNALRKKAEAKKAMLLLKMQEQKGKIALSDNESDDDIDMPETFDDEMWEKVCGNPKPKKVIEEPQLHPQQEIIDLAPEPEKPYDGLDNKAFKELVGKTKRPIGNIKLIDINEEEIMPDKDLWLTKSLTDPEMAPKPQSDDSVDPTRRRKHHITYLAQQAKANEQELQNAWAASKNNRTASRAKYGF
ncbi:unnamed protein product [Phaedon cochleariae]|uniref:Proline-rich protein PRCC n=1 Tax=Phaedon cochleariae TaxID=80249 RepID=A0A9N9SC11_PHACE|nr:unnamed protein product [Phaedon cochleariae]